MEYPYHVRRTVEYGNWGITFYNPNPDRTKNYGIFAGQVFYPCGTRGPCLTNDPKYKIMVDNWINNGVLPE